MDSDFSYLSKDRQKYSIAIGGGIALVGSIISVAIALPLGIVPSVIVGAIAYPVTYKIIQNSNIENYLVDVEIYLKNLKSAFTSWIDNFESLYAETINDLMCKVGLN